MRKEEIKKMKNGIRIDIFINKKGLGESGEFDILPM